MKVLWIIYFLMLTSFVFSQELVKDYGPKVYERADTVYFESKGIKEILYYMRDDKLKTKLTYYEIGVLKSCLNYNKNRGFEGVITYWYENGQKRIEAHYVDGRMVGDDNFGWDSNGEVEYRSTCFLDTCTSVYYYPTGSVMMLSRSKGLELFYEERRCENGQLISIDSVGFASSFTEYFCSGDIKLQSNKNAKGAFIGSYTLYHENNQIRSEGKFKDQNGFESIKDGKWLYYNKKGLKVLEEYYENGIMVSQTSD